MTKTKLYCITCNITGKMYVGITSRDLTERWKEHVGSYTGWRARIDNVYADMVF